MIHSPYPGLRSFTQEEMGIFFGRDKQIEQLLDRLGQAHFIAVVGVSGCGKSSLVKAGLLPALKAGFLAEAGMQWRIATMYPGDHPLHNLAHALLVPSALGPEQADLSHEENLAFLLATLRRGSLGLMEVLEETPLPEKTNLLILVDQFEEIFQQSVECDVNEAIAFVSLLLASTERQHQIFVVTTMRSDFLGDCPFFLGLPEAINDSQFLTPRLIRDQCRIAIQGPAAVFGGSTVEPRLVNHLLNEMGDNPDQLPVLQHCLMRMWQNALQRNRKTEEELRPAYKNRMNEGVEICWQDYERVGEIQNAISQHGKEAIAEVKKLVDQAERTIEYLFRALVEVVPYRRDMRRVVSLNQIASETGLPESQLKEVVEIFRAPRFGFIRTQQGNTLTDTKLYITHESLIRQWDKLNEWADQEVKSVENYRHLEQTARLWEQERAALWGTPDLENTLKWREEEKPTSEWAKRYGSDFKLAIKFLNESDQEQKKNLQRKDRQHRRKLRIVGILLSLAVVIVLLMSILAAWAYWERSKAEEARKDLEKAKDDSRMSWQNAEEALKKAELHSSNFEKMANATFGFLLDSRQNENFLDWAEEKDVIEKCPALS